MAEAEAEASRLGLAISPPVGADVPDLDGSESPVVVIKQMVEAS